MLAQDLEQYLTSAYCVDSDHPAVAMLADELTNSADSDITNTLKLYYWVRDEVRYNPYALGSTRDAFKASAVLASGESWCVPKATLLTALCRAAGMPARLGYADVRNHLSTAKMRETMSTDVFYYHGYCSHYLEGQWVKSTPAFNIELCDKFGLKPLEFDGHADSLYHEFDQAGNKHMQYLHDRGEYTDVPFDEIMANFQEHYAGLMAAVNDTNQLNSNDWDTDVASETGKA